MYVMEPEIEHQAPHTRHIATKLFVVVKLFPTFGPETFAPEQASAAAPALLCAVQRVSVGVIGVQSNPAWNDGLNLPL
jgi:hypothetical protein